MGLRTKVHLLSILTGVALLIGAFLAGASPAGAAGETAVVTGELINVRNGPGTNYDVIGMASQGEQLTVLGQSNNGWYNVGLTNGGQGWVAGWLVEVQQAAETGAGQVAVLRGSGINIRTGPGIGYGIITQGGYGDRFPVLGKSGDWVKIQLSSGAGWVAGWLVSLEEATPATPATPVVAGGGSKVAVINGSVVNIRSGPGTSNAVVGTAGMGDSLPVLSQSGGWVQVSLPSGGSGWVAGWLVALNDASPVSQPSSGETGGEVSRGSDRSSNNAPGKVLSLDTQTTSAGHTTFTVKTDVAVSSNSFFLSNPDRLVVDLQGVTPGDMPQAKDISSKTVTRIRCGYFQKDPDVTRLVFELSSGAQYAVSLSGDHKMLTVDTYIPNVEGSYKNRVIVLDPGHGGPDPGAIGQNGTQEKNVTLDIAKRVSKLLGAKGAKVIMARSADTDVSLYSRTNIANKNNADIFVSIHINAHTDPSIGGTTTYVYCGSGNPGEASRLQESDKLAASIQDELIKTLGLRNIGVKEANFYVVRTANMPAVLIELAFISNLKEEKLLNTDDFKNKAAEAIVRGIGAYFAQKRTA